MYASNYLETKFLNVFRGQAFPAPAKLYVGLFLTSPTDTGTGGIEVTYPNYTRQQITFKVPTVEGLDMGIRNSNNINYPESSVNAGTIRHIGIYDSVTGGNLYLYGDLTDDLQIMIGEEAGFAIDEIYYFLIGDLSNTYKEKFLNIFRGQALSEFIPHLALYNNDPDASGNELAGVDYERVGLQFSAPTTEPSGAQIIRNSLSASFNRPTATWGNWNYTVIYDAKTGGNPVYKKSSPSKNITRGVQPIIPVNAISLGIN